MCSLLFVSTFAVGQGPGRLPLTRADDNVVALSQDSLHRITPFPGLKAIPLNTAKTVHISVGGEIRQQLQVVNNENWGGHVPTETMTNNGTPFLLQRYVLNTNLQLGNYVRVFGELKSGFENGRKTGPRPQIDVDRLDLHQLFADITVNPKANTQVIVRIGRQELNYGASRFLTINEGPNIRLSFQGAKLMMNQPNYFLHVFYMNPISNLAGIFDDRREKSITLWGAYANWKTPRLAKSAFDIYALKYQNKEATFVAGEGEEDRYMIGGRWFRPPGTPFHFDIEANYQTGTFGNRTISAYFAVADVSYEFEEPRWQPQLRFIANVVSGDQSKSDKLGTFNPLFPRVFLGLAVPFIPSNFINLTPIIEMHPTRQLSVQGAAHALWRYSTQDGLYSEGRIFRSPYRIGTTVVSEQSFIGFQYDLTAEYTVTNYFALALYGTLFPAGGYLKETGAGQTLSWSLLQAKWRF